MTTPPASGIDDTYANDDWFDIDQYKKAAQVAYDFSLGKMEKGWRRRTRNNWKRRM